MRTRLFVSLALLIAVAAGATGRKNDSYIYKRGDKSYIRIAGDLGNVDRLSKRYGNEFVWVARGNAEYVIADATTLAAIRNAFRAVDALQPSMEAVQKRMRPYEKRMDALSDQMDALGDPPDEERMEKIERAMEQVEREMAGVEREMERLDDQMEKVEAEAEKEFERIVAGAIARGVAERLR